SLVFVSIGFMAFMTATTLAVDVGMFMTAKSQAQNSADAGALSGAVALYFNDFDDRSSTGPAVQSALSAALANNVMGAQVSVTPADVTFPNNPAGQPNRVAVSVYRADIRDNAIPTLLGKIFGIDTVSLGASATAEVSPANAATCVKPFTIPDRWDENQDGEWDPDDTFDLEDNKGKPLDNPDVYIGPEDKENYTGYDAERDKGFRIVLKANNTSKVTASFYNPWDLPGSVGADDYRENIATCNSTVIPLGATPEPETGNMTGPTVQGVGDLVDLDPGAEWDEDCKCVTGSAYGSKSPRVVVIPVYDPVVFATGPAHGKNIDLKFTNFIGFFIEPMQGNEVVGRITPVSGLFDGDAGPAPAGAFLAVIRLVQ
ncbi:MAG: Tad domain-containing protein, partial [Acidobacteria bacterium]|nr:Tad domain-containing protein [Acidobacteriota bacterium]